MRQSVGLVAKTLGFATALGFVIAAGPSSVSAGTIDSLRSDAVETTTKATVLQTAAAKLAKQTYAPHAPKFARPAPRPGYVWQSGYWRWQGNRRVWQRGRWMPVRRGWFWQQGRYEWTGRRYRWRAGRWVRARAGQRWNRGRWVMRGGRYVWQPGGWVGGGAVAAPVAPPMVMGPRTLPPAPLRIKPRNHRRGHIWVQGHYTWRGGQRVWVNGHWVRQRPGWFYVQGRYDWVGGRWVWRPGRWMARRGQRQYVRGHWARRPNGTYYWVSGRWN